MASSAPEKAPTEVSEKAPTAAPEKVLTQAVLARHRAISAGLLGLLVVLAWAWLLSGAGTGMMPSVALWPHGNIAVGGMDAGSMAGMPMAPAAGSWSALRFFMILAMWWIMMVAMMLPSAAPMILLFARAATHGRIAPKRPATATFLAGYLLAWGLFSLVATILQWQLGRLDLVASSDMASTSRWLSAGVLLLAGAYQLTPLKDACLSRCRNPAQFLSRHYQPGQLGALRMGVLHGAFCVGCCWLLMALLFVGGVMNIAWIALLAALVALEKLVPQGRVIAAGVGAAMILGGILMLLA